MKPLIAYAVTQNLLADFEKTIELQNQFRSAVFPFDMVIVGDCESSGMGIPSIQSNCWVDGKFCLSKVRNASFDYAERAGYDWVVTADVDTLITHRPTIFPRNGFAQVNVFQQPSDARPSEFDLSNPNCWYLQGWYLLHRDIFTKHKFCEEFVGYGFEEDDYRVNVLRGVTPFVTDMRAIHRYHPPRVSQVFNRDLFEERRGPIQAACRIPFC